MKVQEETLKLQSEGNASDAHIHRLQNIDHAPEDEASDSSSACGATDYEKMLASVLQQELQACVTKTCQNPFQVCLGRRIFSLNERAKEPMKLCELGKLAKNGNFFASEDGAVLVKRVDPLEAEMLVEWGGWATKWVNATDEAYPGGCTAFQRTLLTPMFASFQCLAKPYVVMANTTRSLEQTHSSGWRVHHVYDAKPLPNLGEGLVKLFKDLQNEWGSGIAKMEQWDGWSDVRAQLRRDLRFLESRVVDFSLFVHVLKSFGDEQSEPSNGCVADPTKTVMVCFNVLDYLTPLTWVRSLESRYKAHKFSDYGSKFMLAFDCIGDPSQSKCAQYIALASITEAMSVSKGMAKGIFIGSEAFPNAYMCEKQEPLLQYRAIKHTGLFSASSEFGDVIDPKTVMEDEDTPEYLGKEVVWKTSAISDAFSAPWLQSVASPEVGTRYIGDECGNSTDQSDYDCIADVVMDAFSSTRPKELNKETEVANWWTRENIGDCLDGVNEFATETYTSGGNKGAKMHNVLWAPSEKSVIVVRGMPKKVLGIGSGYRHKKAMTRTREKNCFLRMHYFKCNPTESSGVYFNYQQHFGSLEIMVLSTKEQYNQDVLFYYDFEISKKSRLVTDP